MNMNKLWDLVELVSEDYRDSLKHLLELYRDFGSLEEVGASCFYHSALPEDGVGGLLAHTFRVTENLLKLREVLAPEISISDCVLAGVLHDISKGGLPCVDEKGVFKIIPRYVKSPSFDKRRPVTSYNRPSNYAEGQVTFQLAVSAALIAVHFVPNIPVNCLQAICASDGPTVSRSYYHHETKLTLLLEYADRWALAEEQKNEREQFNRVRFGAPLKISRHEGESKDGTITSVSRGERL